MERPFQGQLLIPTRQVPQEIIRLRQRMRMDAKHLLLLLKRLL